MLWTTNAQAGAKAIPLARDQVAQWYIRVPGW